MNRDQVGRRLRDGFRWLFLEELALKDAHT